MGKSPDLLLGKGSGYMGGGGADFSCSFLQLFEQYSEHLVFSQ